MVIYGAIGSVLMTKTVDAEMAEFEAALLRSAKQAVEGVYYCSHTPTEIVRLRGQPVDTAVATNKSSARVVDTHPRQEQRTGKTSSR
jgi:hypothetical protein